MARCAAKHNNNSHGGYRNSIDVDISDFGRNGYSGFRNRQEAFILRNRQYTSFA